MPKRNDDDNDDMYSSSSDDSSSDDDYLASTRHRRGGEGGMVDNRSAEEEREAIIRRKLMESFYGTDAVGEKGSGAVGGGGDEDEDDDDDNTNGLRKGSGPKTKKTKGVKTRPSMATGNPDGSSSASRSSQGFGRNSSMTNGKGGSGRDRDRELMATTTKAKAKTLDLDSPDFSAQEYARNLLRTQNTASLLATDERLSVELRQLDSTMQTLVYENYSKFIDATDAVRSIHTSVESSEVVGGLDRLVSAMDRIGELSETLDMALRPSRTAVTEKVAVRRHLRRLENLLVLPRTLTELVDAGKYRTAAIQHASAAGILARHSGGFESLVRIEEECHGIMAEMVTTLKDRLDSWSNLAAPKSSSSLVIGRSYGRMLSSSTTSSASENMPTSLPEIFECAGTFAVLSDDQAARLLGPPDSETASKFTLGTCRAMALEATAVLLESTLEDHWKRQLSPRRTVKGKNPAANSAEQKDDNDDNNDNDNTDENDVDDEIEQFQRYDDGPSSSFSLVNLLGDRSRIRHIVASELVPTVFLDMMLEACTLFGVTFSSSNVDDHLLEKFVSNSFDTFLGQVKMVLGALMTTSLTSLEETGATEASDDHNNDTDKETEESSLHHGFDEITSAMTALIRSTRELATGLALPEIGVDMSVASGLVERAVELTEVTVRQHVSVEFRHLRRLAVERCLVPFLQEFVLPSTGGASGVVVLPKTKAPSSAGDLLSRTSVAVAEVVNLVDNGVREVASDLASAPVEPSMVRFAVESDAVDFALWLSSALELLAGCDAVVIRGGSPGNGTGNDVLCVPQPQDGDNADDLDHADNDEDVVGGMDDPSSTRGRGNLTSTRTSSDAFVSSSERDGKGRATQEEPLDALRTYLDDLHDNLELSSRMALAVSRVCDMAEKSILDTVDASFVDKKLVHDDNDDNDDSAGNGVSSDKLGRRGFDRDGTVSRCFRRASARILANYATLRGCAAADVIRHHSDADPTTTSVIPTAPRPCIRAVLEVVAKTCLEYTSVYGGPAMANPVRPFDDHDAYHLLYGGPSSSVGFAPGAGAAGVTLEVERMFAQTSSRIYTERLPADRDQVVRAVFRVAMAATVQYARCRPLLGRIRHDKTNKDIDVDAHRHQRMAVLNQWCVDVEFLRHFVHHYVRLDMTGPILNLLDDVLRTVRERIAVEDVTGVGGGGTMLLRDETGRTILPLTVLRKFMEQNPELTQAFVISKDNNSS